MEQLKNFFKEKKIGVYPSKIQAVGSNAINKILYDHKDDTSCRIFCIIDDYEYELNAFDHQIILRTSARKSLLKKNEYIYPYFYSCESEFKPPLPKTQQPIVGFCGWDSLFRKKIIQAVQNEKKMQANFIIRNAFWGGKPHDPGLVQDYQNNIRESHFTICNRGAGNFTMRFYHTLSASRIPVLIDSDIAFPLEDQINYKEFCIIGKNEEDIINQIHNTWQNGDIEHMQQKAGEIFHSKLSMHTYHENLYQSLKSNNQI